MVRNFCNIDADNLRFTKKFEESMTEAENRIQEYLEGVKRSLSEQAAKAQAEMEKKIPEAKNEKIEAAINELW
jgi:F0F1-type ATP synthase membrane subunit b/b'